MWQREFSHVVGYQISDNPNRGNSAGDGEKFNIRHVLVAQTGVEQSPQSPAKSQLARLGGARGGAMAYLQAVVDAWPNLPSETQQAILAICRGARP